ncbi:CHAT domain-containing protein [Fimbriimonas ginsengisoli]|uniref:Tetratricopeptide TPR_2 repeat protein n=1 Tax=Fimbriimonas ginsengisoli Gsoil 348 TaxID=661478 RepID=A0A068NXE0_FIMGI|nr:CHAT domain-containing tetratricopeptide repeat protein [Fimbriimonas ginsengisoli]AIE88076.1 Tetratricopeptide TPR_2 repeat protein [Fimbriimonas ginsengisoli Gsoil 348]
MKDFSDIYAFGSGEPALSPEETRRYLLGLMSDQERAEVDALLSVDEQARAEIEDAREQLALEQVEPKLPPVSPINLKPIAEEPRIGDTAPVAPVMDKAPSSRWEILTRYFFIACLIVGAFLLGGSRLGSPPVAVRDSLFVTQSAELSAARQELARAQEELKHLAADAAENGASRARIKELQKEVDRLKGKLQRPRVGAISSLYLPLYSDSTSLAVLNRMLHAGQKSASGMGATPVLIRPAPGSRGLTERTPRFEFSGLGNKQWQWGLWETEGGAPRRAIPIRQRTAGGRAILEPVAKLTPGRYAVGVRPLEPNSVRAEAERKWRIFRIHVLSPEEKRTLATARLLIRRAPALAAADLFQVDRLDEADKVLAAVTGPQVRDLRRGLDEWRKVAKVGEELSIVPDQLAGAPAPGRPMRIVKWTAGKCAPSPQSTSAQEVVPPAGPGDTLEAVQKLFDQALRLEETNRPEAARLLRDTVAMSRRMRRPSAILRSGYETIQFFVSLDDSESALPYIGPTLEAGRLLFRDDKQTGDKRTSIIVSYTGACYWGSSAYRRLGRFKEARALAQEGQRATRECKTPNLQALLDFEAAMVEWDEGNYEEAAAGFEAHLKVLGELPEGNSGSPLSWYFQFGASQNNLAAARYHLTEFESAAAASDRALALRAKLDPLSVASLLNIRAASRLEMGEFARAEEDIIDARGIYAAHPNLGGEADLMVTLGMLHLRRGNVSDAKKSFAEAKRLALRAKSPSSAATALFDLNSLARALDGGAGAVPGVSSLLKLNNEVSALLFRRRWQEASGPAHEAVKLRGPGIYRALALSNLAWIEAQLGETASALDHFEKSLDLFTKRLSVHQGPESIGSAQQYLVGTVYARYAWTLWRRSKDLRAAQAMLDSGRDLGQKLKEPDSLGRDWHTQIEPIARAIRRHPRTLVVQYAFLDERSTLVIASPSDGAPQAFEIPFDPARLTHAMNDWSPDSSPVISGKSVASERAGAKALGSMLLGRLAAAGLLAPHRFSRIVVAGDAAFHVVPFAALIDGSGKRLVERFAISFAPSLGSLEEARGARARKGLYAAGFAQQLPMDQWALDEVRAVGREIAGAVVRPSEREDWAKRDMVLFRVLLFSCHGSFALRDPMDSYLRIGAGGGDDGVFRAREVAAMQLRADLAVLSACETGVGAYAGGRRTAGAGMGVSHGGLPKRGGDGLGHPGRRLPLSGRRFVPTVEGR